MENYIHKTQYYETDQMGIIHHSNYFRWFEEARVDFLEKIGYGYDRLEDEGIISPVLKISCEYKGMIRFNDSVEISLKLLQATPYKFEIYYEILDCKDGGLRAFGMSSHCYLNRDGIPVSIKKLNPDFYEKFKKYIAG
ncbi:MAG: acyl-CoA thioesterase [Firmicutes bacterium]|nr:acyl-CoA thioesterase [Bacillota bacterium]